MNIQSVENGYDSKPLLKNYSILRPRSNSLGSPFDPRLRIPTPHPYRSHSFCYPSNSNVFGHCEAPFEILTEKNRGTKNVLQLLTLNSYPTKLKLAVLLAGIGLLALLFLLTKSILTKSFQPTNDNCYGENFCLAPISVNLKQKQDIEVKKKLEHLKLKSKLRTPLSITTVVGTFSTSEPSSIPRIAETTNYLVDDAKSEETGQTITPNGEPFARSIPPVISNLNSPTRVARGSQLPRRASPFMLRDEFDREEQDLYMHGRSKWLENRPRQNNYRYLPPGINPRYYERAYEF